MTSRLFLLSAALLLSGCTVGPNYKRPTVAVPGSYRGTIPDEAAQTQLTARGDQKWWGIFQDEQLRTLIHTAFNRIMILASLLPACSKPKRNSESPALISFQV